MLEGAKGPARNGLGRRNMDASVGEKGRHVGSFHLQEQKVKCIWISKRCMAVKTAANAFMVSL